MSDVIKMKQDHICRITPLNPSDSLCNQAAYKALLPHFSWESQVWIQGQFAKTAKKYREHCFHPHEKKKGYYYFPTGLIQKAFSIFEEKRLPCNITAMGFVVPSTDPEIPGIELRDNQIKAIAAATKAGRGIIHASTGSGKSFVAYGIFQAYLQANEGEKCLFLAHTIDLVKQAAKEFRSLGAKVGIWQGKERTDGDIICSTIQTLSKMPVSEHQGKFICFVLDECFHKDTTIRVGSGTKKISEIIVGDMVQTSDGQRKVTNIFKTSVPLERVCRVNLSNGKTIFCSVDHVFITPSGEVKAKDLTGKEIGSYGNIMRVLRKKRRRKKI